VIFGHFLVFLVIFRYFKEHIKHTLNLGCFDEKGLSLGNFKKGARKWPKKGKNDRPDTYKKVYTRYRV